MTRLSILHVMPSVDPRGGGPTEGVIQTGKVLVALGHMMEVVTLDDPKAPFLSEYPFRCYALGPPRGQYYYSSRFISWLRANANRYDTVIVHGLWQFHAVATRVVMRRLGLPYIVFVHGMLDPWFRAAYPKKHLKKLAYWLLAERAVVRDARLVLFTCEEERHLARRSFPFYRANEAVVSYGSAEPPPVNEAARDRFVRQFPEILGRRVLLFLGRIHPKKGCDLLIKAFARVAQNDRSLHLMIAGPDQTGWLAELQKLAVSLDVDSRITWTGMLTGESKWAAFRCSHAFVLPSHQENFGIAVAEALGCGLPVLVSNKVNIWREVLEYDVGFVGEDTVDGTVECIEKWMALDDAARTDMSARAYAAQRKKFSPQGMAQSLIDAISV
jgi:glycosyltransferase involved in cell wall biosynthesis